MPRGMEAVCALLRAIDCEEYAEACRNSGYDDAEYLLSMKQADLDEFASAIGMLKGHQKKMERMLQQRPMSQSAQQLATDATATLLRLALGENVELRQRLSHVESRLADIEARMVDAPAFAARGRGGRGGRGAGRLPAGVLLRHDLAEQPTVGSTLPSLPSLRWSSRSCESPDALPPAPTSSEAPGVLACDPSITVPSPEPSELPQQAKSAARRAQTSSGEAESSSSNSTTLLAPPQPSQSAPAPATVAAPAMAPGPGPPVPVPVVDAVELPNVGNEYRTAADGVKYTKTQFREFFGPSWKKEWHAAGKRGPPPDKMAKVAEDTAASPASTVHLEMVEMARNAHLDHLAELAASRNPDVESLAAAIEQAKEAGVSADRLVEFQEKLAARLEAEVGQKEQSMREGTVAVAPLTTQNLRALGPPTGSRNIPDEDAASERTYDSAGGMSLATSQATSAITLESNYHSRMRMGERDYSDKRELQLAIKMLGKGATEEPTLGPHGEPRLRIKHQDVVFITDDTRKVLITALPRRWYELYAPPEQRQIELKWYMHREALDESRRHRIAPSDQEARSYEEQEPRAMVVTQRSQYKLSNGEVIPLYDDRTGSLLSEEKQAEVIAEHEARIAAELENRRLEGAQLAAMPAAPPAPALAASEGDDPAHTSQHDALRTAPISAAKANIDAGVRERLRQESAEKRKARKAAADVTSSLQHQAPSRAEVPTQAQAPRRRKVAADLVLADTQLPLSAAATWALEKFAPKALDSIFQRARHPKRAASQSVMGSTAMVRLLKEPETFSRETELDPERRLTALRASIGAAAQPDQSSELAQLPADVAIDLQVRSRRLTFPVVMELLRQHRNSAANRAMQCLLHSRLSDAPEKIGPEGLFEVEDAQPWKAAFALIDGRVPFRAIEQLVARCCENPHTLEGLREVLQLQRLLAGCLHEADMEAGLRTCLVSDAAGLDALAELLGEPVSCSRRFKPVGVVLFVPISPYSHFLPCVIRERRSSRGCLADNCKQHTRPLCRTSAPCWVSRTAWRGDSGDLLCAGRGPIGQACKGIGDHQQSAARRRRKRTAPHRAARVKHTSNRG